MDPVRTLVVWCPDWPVLALGARCRDPAAVFVGNRVVAATAAARVEGVAAGLRRREAQARCPALEVLERDLDKEARTFEVVLAAAATFTPLVEASWPGSCAFPTRGPSRYFGGDEALATAVASAVDAALARILGADPTVDPTVDPAVDPAAGPGERPEAEARCLVGVADGPFAARLAARAATTASTRTTVVAPGGTAAFLAPLPLSVLEPESLVDVLGRLGLGCVGDVAALPAASVLGRFGREGERAHRLARGLDELPPDVAAPAEDLTVVAELDPPVERVDQAAFAAKSLADRLSAALDTSGWSCLRLAVEAETEHGERLVRLWRHEGALTAGAMAERVRWQLEGWLTASRGAQPTGGLVRLALVPDQVVPATGRQLGFWGGHDEAATRASRAAARLASMLGPDAVRVADPRGGRVPTEEYRTLPATAVDLVERADSTGRPAPPPRPWPGRLPVPSPSVVPAEADRRSVDVLDEAGGRVLVSGRGLLSAPPARVRTLPSGPEQRVVAWAGPWPLEERWWDAAAARRQARCQVVTDDGAAWLLVLEGGSWSVAALYD